MSGETDPRIHALSRTVAAAGDQQIIRIVAAVDAMTQRGQVDLLIEILRPRLTALRPPRPLRFGRLMFHPLDLLIVPASRWRPDQPGIPRTALMPMARHVRQAMGAAATAIDSRIIGRTTDDTALISHLGPSLWPQAAAILVQAAIPKAWSSTQLGGRSYRPLADAVAAMLAEAVTIDTLHAEAATGLLPPSPGMIATILSRVALRNEAALPMALAMVLAILLDRLPSAAALLFARPGCAAAPAVPAAAAQAALNSAADLLLRHLGQDDGIATRIGAGTLTEAAAAAHGMIALLRHLGGRGAKPRRREQVRVILRDLDAACQARFTSGLQDQVLAPLQGAHTDIQRLESAARGLRMLETEARAIGGGAFYDMLLDKAAQAIEAHAMPELLSTADQVRLIEIMKGPDAALAMLDQRC